MSLTRATVETILIRRCGQLLEQCGLDGVTSNGQNADLNDPIGKAVRTLGYAVAYAAFVDDGDLSAVADDETDALLDVAELRVLESCAGNLTTVDITIGPRSESLGQLGARLEQRIAAVRARVLADHGIGLGTLNADVITLDFMQKFGGA